MCLIKTGDLERNKVLFCYQSQCLKNPQTLNDLEGLCNSCIHGLYFYDIYPLAHELKREIISKNSMSYSEELLIENMIVTAIKKGELFMVNEKKQEVSQ